MKEITNNKQHIHSRCRKLLLLIPLLSLLFTIPLQNVYAVSPAIRNIDISVVLTPEGDAQITEVWDVTVASGTEWYLRKDHMGEMEVQNFRVSDETGTLYQDTGRWDVDKNIAQKTAKSGIHRDGSAIELCWGVGAYGDHVFTAQYTMTNMVNAYADNEDGFNIKFINDDLSSNPQNIRVTIEKEGESFLPEQTGVWAFGFTGNISVQDGKIVAVSESPLNTRNDEVIILCRFDQGIFQPRTHTYKSFEEVKQEAFVGSDYGTTDDNRYDDEWYDGGSYVRINSFKIGGIFFAIIPIIIIFALICAFAGLQKSQSGGKGKDRAVYLPLVDNAQGKKYHTMQDVDYVRDIPFDGAIPPPSFLLAQARMAPADSDIFGCYLLRLLNKGCINFIQTEKQGLFKSKTESAIHLLKAPESGEGQDFAEMSMFKLLAAAAGRDDILEEKRMYTWGTKNYTKIENFIQMVTKRGEHYLKANQYIDTVEKGVWVFKWKATELNRAGSDAVLQLLGFKKYLHDFTIINERRAVEVHLWQDYLIFAQLFGIAEQVAKDFKDIYPDFFDKEGYGANGYSNLYLLHSFSQTSSRAVAAAHSSERSSGGGGSSSSGGGGGSSGGSSGGGSR